MPREVGAHERRVSNGRVGRRPAREGGMAKQRDVNTTEEKPQSRSAGDMTVREAGRLGGHKGGQRVKELIEEGKRAEGDAEAEKKR